MIADDRHAPRIRMSSTARYQSRHPSVPSDECLHQFGLEIVVPKRGEHLLLKVVANADRQVVAAPGFAVGVARLVDLAQMADIAGVLAADAAANLPDDLTLGAPLCPKRRHRGFSWAGSQVVSSWRPSRVPRASR